MAFMSGSTKKYTAKDISDAITKFNDELNNTSSGEKSNIQSQLLGRALDSLIQPQVTQAAFFGVFDGFLDRINNSFNSGLRAALKEIINNWVSTGYLERNVGDSMYIAMASRPILGYLIATVFPILTIVGQVMSITQAAKILSDQRVLAITRPKTMDENSAIRLGIINDNLKSKGDDALHKMGYGDDQISYMRYAQQQLLNSGELAYLKYRKKMTTEDIKPYLRHLGYGDTDAQRKIDLMEYIPGVQDLIMMAVKEAFNEQMASQLDLDSEFPTDILPWTQANGLSDEFSRKYWRAHWNLPSATQGFEMLHRGQISTDELKTLLHALDYAPKWREKLQNISYNVMTRVDVRRLYNDGVINKDRVLELYKAMGYNAQTATELTTWTIKQKSSPTKELVKSEVITAYKDRITSRAGSKTALVNLGYDDDDADTLLDIAEFQNASEARKKAIENNHLLYTRTRVSAQECRADMLGMGVDPNYIEELLENWEIELETTRRQPTKTDADNFYLSGAVTEMEYRAILYNLNYANDMIDNYVKYINSKKKG